MRAAQFVGLATAVACAPFASAKAQQLGGVAQGHRLAQRICAQCHLVDDVSGRSNNAAAPRFVMIANIPGLTNAKLIAMLQTSHRTMPNIVIKGGDLDDIVAYIRSLKDGN